ncbi:MAG: DUF1223 domain-containing protein [Proteobacteria bacterium]|nr:DUF1223 domain-containing protein [Pseudomonadota bacterium]
MKRIALIIFFLSFIFAGNTLAGDLVVVELFTSQGCEKCPPANKLLAELAEEKNILALSWHVDYWDYQGWEDTLADPEHTRRQENYNQALGRKGVYTPQIIINGRREVVGSNKLDLYQTIQSALIANELPVTVRLEGSAENLQVRLGGSEDNSRAVVVLVWYDSLQKIKIGAGANAGKTITYANVVRKVKNLGEWQGEAVTFAIDLRDPGRGGADCLAILVQDGETGRIIGATKITLDSLPE